MLNKIKRWIQFNLRYLGRPPWDTGISPPELQYYLKSTPVGRALDVGCGTGTNLLTMATQGWEVVGVDFAGLSVIKSRIKLRNAGYNGRVIHGDVTGDLGFETPFDLVLDIGCYHSLSPTGRQKYRDNLKGWLRSGGTLLMYAHWRTSGESAHGISETDLEAFQSFLTLKWRDDGDEVRKDGGGEFPATWVKYTCLESKQ